MVRLIKLILALCFVATTAGAQEFTAADAEAGADAGPAAQRPSSEHAKAGLLIEAGRLDLCDEASRASFFEALDGMRSDYHRGRVLLALVREHGAEPEVLLRAVRAVGSLSSDFKKARILKAIARLDNPDAAVRAALREAALLINTQRHRERALAAISRNWLRINRN